MSMYHVGEDDEAFDHLPFVPHEVDECADCHKAGEHDAPLNWFEECEKCADEVKRRASHASYEFRFSVIDVEKARNWAKANHYRYEGDLEHLLIDAMRSHVIEPGHWESISE